MVLVALHLFQSTLPVGGATFERSWICSDLEYFNPRSPWGERRCVWPFRCRESMNFNPRSPWGERRYRKAYGSSVSIFQSTLPVGGATREYQDFYESEDISIHAPRGGSDQWSRAVLYFQSISIHAPRGGSDAKAITAPAEQQKFQSTLPVGGATVVALVGFQIVSISIHAPRGGSDHG